MTDKVLITRQDITAIGSEGWHKINMTGKVTYLSEVEKLRRQQDEELPIPQEYFYPRVAARRQQAIDEAVRRVLNKQGILGIWFDGQNGKTIQATATFCEPVRSEYRLIMSGA